MKKILSYLSAILICFATLQTVAFARAGGGGGSSGGGGGRRIHFFIGNLFSGAASTPEILLSILAIIIEFAIIGSLIASTVIVFISLKRSRAKSKILLEKLGKSDPLWNPKTLDKHVRDSFFKIQKAWSDDNIQSVRHLLSDKLYADFSLQLERNRKGNVRNELSKIKIIKAYPVSVHDRIGEDNDCIRYFIKASMIDLTVDVTTRQVLSEIKKPMKFVEYWCFRKKDGSWVLDEISSEQEFKKSILNT